jgi:transcriptional regulator with XRE-family HTH domain
MQEILSKEEIGKRIKEVRIENSHSQAFVSEILKISRSNYSQIEIGNQYPSFESLSKIASYYSKSYDWLLHGRESDAYFQRPAGFSRELPAVTMVSTEKFLHVTENEYVKNLKSVEYLEQLPSFDLPSLFIINDGRCRSFTIENNMLTYINSSDIVIGRFLKNYNEIWAGKAYIIVTNKEILYCQVENVLIEKAALTCKSDQIINSRFLLSFDEIQEIWEVVGKYSKIIQPVIEELETTFQSFATLIQKLEHEVTRLVKKAK